MKKIVTKGEFETTCNNRLVLFRMLQILILLLVLPTAVFSATVDLEWDPSLDPNLAGYKVYYQGRSSALPFQSTEAAEGSAPVDVGNATTARISGLDSFSSYFFAVTAYNSAGVESVYSNIIEIQESVPPVVAITSPLNTTSVRDTVQIIAEASDNVVVSKVEFYVNDVLQSADSEAPYSFTWDTSTLTGGVYTLSAKAFDPAENLAQSDVTVTVTADMALPRVSFTEPVANASVSGNVTIRAAASDDTGVTRIQIFHNDVLTYATNENPAGYTWDTTLEANGTHSLRAEAYDAAGNVGHSANVILNVLNDMTAPAISIVSPLTSGTVGGTVAVSANATDNIEVSRVEFYVDNALKSLSTSAPYGFNWNTATMANGAYMLSAKAYDSAGNIGQSSVVIVSVFNDTTAPAVSIASPTTDSTAGGTVAVSANATDNVSVSTVEFFVNGALKATSTHAPYGFSWNTGTVANGAYTLSAKAYDAAGNIGISSSVKVNVSNDIAAPTVSIASPLTNSTAGGTVAVSANASDNVAVSTIEFYVNGALKASSTSAPYSFSWNTATVANGPYTLSAKAYDAAGNVGLSSSVTVTVFNDTTAPTVSIASPLTNNTAGGTVAVSANATDNVAVSKVEFYVNGALKANSTSAPYGFSWNTATVANGAYTLTAKAYDAAGNVGESANATVSVFNDITPPVVSIASPLANSAAEGTVAVSANASDNVAVSKVEFYVNGALKANSTSEPYSFSWNTATVANGAYTLSAKAYDAAGNVGQSANATVNVFNDTAPPAVSIVSPLANSTAGGTVAVSANATDNVAVSRVEFHVNGALRATSTSAPYGFNWNTAELPNGFYQLSAKAYDAAGNVGISSSVTVTVDKPLADTTAPRVLILSPTKSAVYGSKVNISSSATDNVAVTRMELYIDGSLKFTTTSSTFKTAWNFSFGLHTITVKAYDAANNVMSASRTLNRFF